MNDTDRKFTLADRRNVLRTLGVAATLAFPGWVMGKSSLWVPEDLPVTPQQTEGPFYPRKSIEQQLVNDTDLSRKLAGHEFAKGQQAVVEGVIRDRKGAPLKGSLVEIWQACATGRYNHSRDDDNSGLLDNNFQFWGRAITGEDGKYSFKTIIPGKYPGRTARHIHYRVDAEGFRRCSTQCYFSDFGEDNMRDGLYLDLNRKERELVTIEFDKPVETKKAGEGAKPAATNSAPKSNENAKEATAEKALAVRKPWSGQFDIVMAKK